jgi:hypothetical protein
MINLRPRDTTRVCGKSQGYAGLNVRDTAVDLIVGAGEIERVAAMDTLWEPTPKELEALNAGKPVLITILGTTPPPIRVGVEP